MPSLGATLIGTVRIVTSLLPAFVAAFALAPRVEARPRAHESAQLFAAEAAESVRAASVLLSARACTGVVVGSARVVATAAHCLIEGRTHTPVEFSDGTKQSARVVHVDVDRDVALLVVDTPSAIVPLELAAGMPQPGAKLLFLGRPDRARARHTSVTRLGPCPSLPKLRAAAFTTLSAVPGDSGAPLVDEAGRVVALVHGGARCHIAVPVRPLRAAFLGLPWDVRVATPAQVLPEAEAPPPDQDAPGDASDASAGHRTKVPDVHSPSGADSSAGTPAERFGPFVFERTKKGFKFRFAFSFGTPSKN